MKTKPLLSLFLTAVLLWACNPDKNNCLLPPDGFSETDLVGTWIATRLPSTDTLVIRADGTYKQIIHIETPDVDYESGWLSWRLEYSESGSPYLHMEDLRLCAYLPDVMNCEQSGGGDFYFYDFCRDESFQMSDEGTLIVLGTSPRYPQPPRGIHLTLLAAWPERVWTYERVEP